MLGDLRILDTDAELLLDTERVSLQPLFNLIRRGMIGYEAELHKRTLERGLLSLIGPDAQAVAGADGLLATEHAHTELEVNGVPVRAIRTDLGVDLLCDATRTGELRRALQDAGAVPVSRGDRRVRPDRARPPALRRRPRRRSDPAGGRAQRARGVVHEGLLRGPGTVARLHYRGKPNRLLRGLRLSAPVEAGIPLELGDREVGRVGSSAVSPGFGPIALALVRREAEPGSLLTAGGAEAEVVELPFG